MRESSSLVPGLHSPVFYCTVYKVSANFIHSAIKNWGVETGDEAVNLVGGCLQWRLCSALLARNKPVRRE